MVNSISDHITGLVSLHKFTFEEGHLADGNLSVPLSWR
jgi:hypothetical protein